MPIAFNNTFPIYQSGFQQPFGENLQITEAVAISRVTVSQTMTVTATASTDFSFTIPQGALITGIDFYTSTTFTGATVTAAVGSAQGGAQYVAAVSIVSQGKVAATFVGTGIPNLINMPAGTNNLWIRIAQTTPTAVGSALAVVSYSMQ